METRKKMNNPALRFALIALLAIALEYPIAFGVGELLSGNEVPTTVYETFAVADGVKEAESLVLTDTESQLDGSGLWRTENTPASGFDFTGESAGAAAQKPGSGQCEQNDNSHN